MKRKLPRNIHKRHDGKYEIRVTYIDDDGKRRALHEVTDDLSKDHVESRVGAMKAAIDRKRRGMDVRPVPVSMGDIIKRFKADEMTEPVYRDGIKVAGKRSLATPLKHLEVIDEEFGSRNPRGISYSDIKNFKIRRLETPIKFMYKTRRRSIASVNREMSMLRQVMNYAVREGWIDRNPFNNGPNLIKLSDETPRATTITLEEEKALLKLCTKKAVHMRHVLTCILYGGFRKSELLSLTWDDVNFSKGIITLRAENTKTNKSRIIPMHEKVEESLRWCKTRYGKTPFPFNDVRSAFLTLRGKINRPDLRLHDLRATFSTRLLDNGVPLHIVQVLMGHTTTLVTLKHYARPDLNLLRKAVDTLPNGFWTVQEIREVLASARL